MHAMVIYDSMYGNTERIARAIADELAKNGTVEIVQVDAVETVPSELDLLVVGGPTQGHGIDPAEKAFLDHLPAESLQGISVAAFDTRLRWPELLSGSAAKGIAKQLEKKGAQLVLEPESFFVEGKDGPLGDGELERAAAWARQVAGALSS